MRGTNKQETEEEYGDAEKLGACERTEHGGHWVREKLWDEDYHECLANSRIFITGYLPVCR